MNKLDPAMSLPPQDLKDSYTPDEVQHLIAREWAKNEILSLKNSHFEMQKQLVEFMGTNQADSKALRELLTSIPVNVAKQIDSCRADMRREVDSDFHSRLDAERMERKIEEKISETDKTLGKQISEIDRKVVSLEDKIDSQWLKITVAVGTIVATGTFVTWLISTGKALL